MVTKNYIAPLLLACTSLLVSCSASTVEAVSPVSTVSTTVEETWLENMGVVFNVGNDVYKSEEALSEGLIFTSIVLGDLDSNGNVDYEKPTLTLNHVDNMGATQPVWTYRNPDNNGKCCSCGLCAPVEEGFTVMEPSSTHEYDEHGNIIVTEEYMVSEAERILSAMFDEHPGGGVSFTHTVDNKTTVSFEVYMNGEQTGLTYSFYFNTSGEIHTATGDAVVLELS